MRVTDLGHFGEATTMRTLVCTCGERWESVETRSRRLTPVAAGSHRLPRVDTGCNGPPPAATGPRPLGWGVGGGLSSGSDLGPDQTGQASSRPQSQTRPRVDRSIQETPAFIAFYEAYPRKKARPDALKAWRQMRCEESAAAVMTGLVAHTPELRGRALDKVPYPASWLRARGWEDPVEGPPARAAALPFALAAEEGRQQRATDSRIAELTERLRPSKPPMTAQQIRQEWGPKVAAKGQP